MTFLQVTDADHFTGRCAGFDPGADSMIAAKSAAWLLNGKAVGAGSIDAKRIAGTGKQQSVGSDGDQTTAGIAPAVGNLAMSIPQAGQEAQHQHLEKLQTQEADLARQVSQATGGRVRRGAMGRCGNRSQGAFPPTAF